MEKKDKIELLRLLLNFMNEYDIELNEDECLGTILYELVQEIIR